MSSLSLLFALLLLVSGIVLLITRRNAVMAIMGIELMLNSANVAFLSVASRWPDPTEAHLAVLIVIIVAAAEAAVGLALVYNLWRRQGSIDLGYLLRDKPGDEPRNQE